jgi:hypothetical protein
LENLYEKANYNCGFGCRLDGILLTICNPAEARAHRHWYHYSDYALYHDYSYGNWQSPWTYIYPAANWGPFFHRVRHYGPVRPI